MNKDVADLLESGYQQSADKLDRAHRHKLAAQYQPDPKMERLIELRKTDPAAFRSIGPTGLLSVAHYSAQKSAYKEEQKESRS